MNLTEPLKRKLDNRIEKTRPHLHPKSELNEWIGVVANLWDTISMIGVLITGLVILLFFRDNSSGILDVVILAVCAMAVVTISISVFIVRSWKTTRDFLRENLAKLEPGPWVVMDVLLRYPDRIWTRRELYEECQRHMHHANPTEADYQQLRNIGLVIVSSEYVQLSERCKGEREYLLRQMNHRNGGVE